MAHIIIGNDNRCTCGCESKCPFHKSGSAFRCTKEELEAGGYGTVKVKRNLWGQIILAEKVKHLNV